MFKNEWQVFFFQCCYESQMFSCLFHECHRGQQVQGAWEEAGHLRCTRSELLAGPRDLVLKRKRTFNSVKHVICQHWKHILRLG